MLSPYQFILRTFQQPEGFEIPIISGDDFTDAQISNLYYYFMCCFCQRFYNEYTAQLKRDANQ